MSDRDFILTIAVLGGLAAGVYWIIQKNQPQPTPVPSLPSQRQPNPLGSDVVQSPTTFGLSNMEPCKRFPSLCKFW